jgi:hypothetical protein
MKLQRTDFVMRERTQEAETLLEVFVEFLIMVVALFCVPVIFYYLGPFYAAVF